ncbi:MAG TPA: polysaccharide export protein EpsE [Usitatibacter sp.]|jgi:polysaccharide export outer membrane protein|nr:polysaccharide export protein EpsE [Usitatibacter sp.]
MNAKNTILTLALAALAPASFAAQKVADLSVTSQSAPAIAMAQPSAAAVMPSADLRLEALGMGDMIRITVFRNPELTTEARVNERGGVLFPLVGEVPVAGLTPAQAAQRIGDKLRAGRYVVNPEVTVSAMQVNSRQVSVLGNVVKPGRYPIDSTNMRLTDFLASAGGIAPTGSERVTILTNRNGRAEKLEVDVAEIFRSGDLSRNVSLEPGDTIFVERAPMVYVYGEVQKGGSYRLEPNMTVMQAIAMGGGITPRGTDRGIKISRPDGNGGTRRIDVGLTDRVRPDDVIQVQESLF